MSLDDDRDGDDERHSRRRRRDPDDDYDDYDDRPRRRPEPEVEATEFLIPTGVSAASMAACYFGVFSCVMPLLGIPMAMIALPCGIVALRRKKKKKRSTYGLVTGDVRAVIGIVFSSLTLIGYAVIFAIAAAGGFK